MEGGAIKIEFVDTFYVSKHVYQISFFPFFLFFFVSSSNLACVSMGRFGLNVFGVEWLQMPLFLSYSREPIRVGQKREREIRLQWMDFVSEGSLAFSNLTKSHLKLTGF